MALSKFEKDMAVIQKLDDEPNDVGGLTAAELKAKFDEGGEAVKKYLNDTLTPELEHGFSEKVPSSTTINGHPLTGDVTITKSDIWLGNVDNTSDLDKPVSRAQQAALDTLDKEKADAANVLTKDNHTPYTPTEPDHPATKGYVDETTAGVVMGQLPDSSVTTAKLAGKSVTTDKIADRAVTPEKLDRAYLPLSGGTLTGPLTLHGDPQSPLQAAPKQYVDSVRAITRRLPVAPGYSVKAGDVVDVGPETTIISVYAPVKDSPIAGSPFTTTKTCDIDAYTAETILYAESPEGKYNADIFEVNLVTRTVKQCAMFYNGDGINLIDDVRIVSLLDNERYVVMYLISGVYRAKIGRRETSGLSSEQSLPVGPASSGDLVTINTHGRIFIVTNTGNGISAMVSDTGNGSISAINGRTYPANVSEATRNLKAELLSLDSDGSAKVAVGYLDSSYHPCLLIAEISAAGDVVVWSEPKRVIENTPPTFTFSVGDSCMLFADQSGNVATVDFNGNVLKTTKPFSHLTAASAHFGEDRFVLFDIGNAYPIDARNDFTTGDRFSLTGIYFNQLVACRLSTNMVAVAYAGGKDSSKNGVVTSLKASGLLIGGDLKPMSKEAIALQDGNAGDLIDIIYSGTADLLVAQGTKIESLGVQGYAPVEGLLDVYPWYLPGVKIATGSYVGTGKYGSDSPVTIKTPFKPKFVVIQSKSNISSYNGHVGVAAYGAGWIKISSSYNSTSEQPATLIWMDDGVSFYSGYGDYNQFNFKAEYVYTIFG